MKQRVYNKLIFIFSSKIAGTIVTGVFLLGTTIATGVVSTHYKLHARQGRVLLYKSNLLAIYLYAICDYIYIQKYTEYFSQPYNVKVMQVSF